MKGFSELYIWSFLLSKQVVIAFLNFRKHRMVRPKEAMWSKRDSDAIPRPKHQRPRR